VPLWVGYKLYIFRNCENFSNYFSPPPPPTFIVKEIEGSFERFLNISFFEMEYRNLVNYLADMCSNHPCTTVIKWGGQGGCYFEHLFSAQDTDVPIYFLA